VKDDFLAALSHELRTPLTPALALLSNTREMPAEFSKNSRPRDHRERTFRCDGFQK
jgi:signal transduction histidine kinase